MDVTPRAKGYRAAPATRWTAPGLGAGAPPGKSRNGEGGTEVTGGPRRTTLSGKSARMKVEGKGGQIDSGFAGERG